MSVEKILELINREIIQFSFDIKEYRKKMDESMDFNKQYWLYHDKYQSAYIKKTYLVDLLKRIRGMTADEVT